MNKPLNQKSYGSIPHLPGSRQNRTDKGLSGGQAKIVLSLPRKDDIIIVQEKLDGSNVCVANIEGTLISLGRSGHPCVSSNYEQHRYFDVWVQKNLDKFKFLKQGQRVCGEWLLQAHGSLYDLPHEPFVAFDIFTEGYNRLNYKEFSQIATDNRLIIPRLIQYGSSPIDVENILKTLDNGKFYHGCLEELEGFVVRVEHKGKVDFLTKYVRPSKVDGKYLMNEHGKLPDIWNKWNGECAKERILKL